MKANELRARIAAKFGKTSDITFFPSFVVLYEVPITGRVRPGYEYTQTRSRQRIDAVAVGVWPKTENEIHGFEVKVSRSDLLVELKDLTKSAAAVASCDRWWLVLSDKSLLKPTDQVPASWGILAARGRGLTVIREAERNTEARPDPSFVAGLVTRALVQPTIGREARFQAGLRRGQQWGEQHGKHEYARGENMGYWRGRREGREESWSSLVSGSSDA